MTSDEEKRASDLLLAFATMRERTMETGSIELFLDLLPPDFTFEEFERGLRMHAQDPQGVYLPAPANIIGHARGSPDDRAEVAWACFVRAAREQGGMRSVIFADPGISNAVRVLGLWPDCTWTEFEDGSLRKQFKAIYKNCSAPNRRLPGRAEISNRHRGFIEGDTPRLNGKKAETVVIGEMGKAMPPGEAQPLLDSGSEDKSQKVLAKLREMIRKEK